MSDPFKAERNRLPEPHRDFAGPSNSGGLFSKIAKLWQPKDSTAETAAATVSRYTLRLIDRVTRKAYSADELPVSDAQRDTFADKTLSNTSNYTSRFDVMGAGSVVNRQLFCAAKMAGWSGGGASEPLFIVGCGDSIFDGLNLGPYMRYAGVIGLNVYTSSGHTQHTPPGDAAFDDWINGRSQTIAVGGNAVYTVTGGDTGGDIQGDSAFVAYVKQSTGGSFDLEVMANKSGTWVPFGAGTGKTFTVDTSTDTFTAASHGMPTGTGVRLTNSGGALPTAAGGDLAINTTYIVINTGANTFKLARTPALAAAGTAIDITGAGTGTHTATPYTSLGINTANATTIGAAFSSVAGISTVNSPYYRIRVTNVLTASVDILFTGLYASIGGGAVWCPIGAFSGNEISQVVTTPQEVFAPVWAALKPTAVLCCWADPAADWEPGGNFRTFYENAKAAYASSDFIVISTHASLNGEEEFARQRLTQREWALETGNTWINGRDWMPDYETAFDLGWMANDGSGIHLSSTGKIMRNLHIFSTIPLYQWPMGSIGGPHPVAPSSTRNDVVLWELVTTGNIDARVLTTKHPIRSSGSGGGYIIGDRNQPLSSAFDWTMYATGDNFGSSLCLFHQAVNRLVLDRNGALTLANGLTISPPASVTPASNGQLMVEATSNTSLTFKLKGSDGTVRSGSLALS